jgi:hypothetical protein
VQSKDLVRRGEPGKDNLLYSIRKRGVAVLLAKLALYRYGSVEYELLLLFTRGFPTSTLQRVVTTENCLCRPTLTSVALQATQP